MLTKDDKQNSLKVTVETPKGSDIKYKYDEQSGAFVFDKILPFGHVFPFNFGFLPHTLAPDGDPLDALVLLEHAVVVGCIVPCRLLGVIEALQTEAGQEKRNDRLICVAEKSELYGEIHSMQELNADLTEGIEQFFISYNLRQGRKFEVRGRFGASHAMKSIRAGEAAYLQKKHLRPEKSA
jgi:inorganic pyrophosphatase